MEIWIVEHARISFHKVDFKYFNYSHQWDQIVQYFNISSKLAQGVAIFSLSMVVVSTTTFILSTVEELQQDEEGNIKFPNVAFTIELIDSFIVIFFTVEYLLRLVICPNKLRFIKDPLNVVDFAAIVPFYVSILLEGLEDYEIIGKTGKIIRLVRVMRVLRLFKLVRHFAGLQSLLHTLKQAYQVLYKLFKEG